MKVVFTRARLAQVRSVSCHAAPMRSQVVKEDIEKAVKYAMDLEKQYRFAESAVAWDIVEEISAAFHDQKLEAAAYDVLEGYCSIDESAFECRVYDC